MRKLASIKEIDSIEPIQNADNIMLAKIGGWDVVFNKDSNHSPGDRVVYCEIDSFLPVEPEFEFLRKSSFKRDSLGHEGFRLRTIKLRGQVSQGLIIPLSDALNIMNRNVTNVNISEDDLTLNQDVSDLLGIIKWEPPIPAQLSGVIVGYFPSFINKTDEPRIQNLFDEYKRWNAQNFLYDFYVTEKLDGSSATFYLNNGKFGVCSRNLEFKEDDKNTFWKTAKDLHLGDRLRSLGKNIALQGELIGEGIQSNIYKIKGHTVKFFNVFDIDKNERVSYEDFIDIIKELELETVPIINEPGFDLPDTPGELITIANDKSRLCDVEREGLVIRSKDNRISFKVISNSFLLNE